MPTIRVSNPSLIEELDSLKRHGDGLYRQTKTYGPSVIDHETLCDLEDDFERIAARDLRQRVALLLDDGFGGLPGRICLKLRQAVRDLQRLAP